MKHFLSVLLIAVGLIVGNNATAQSFNAKLKIGSKDNIDVISTSSPSYKEIIQSGVTTVLEYYQQAPSGNDNGSLKSMLAKYNEHFIEGAEVSTLFITDQDVMVDNEVLPAGTYGMFTTINDEKVILIFKSVKKSQV